jgi:hypothetical protein
VNQSNLTLTNGFLNVQFSSFAMLSAGVLTNVRKNIVAHLGAVRGGQNLLTVMDN